jgi:hypothetical protein
VALALLLGVGLFLALDGDSPAPHGLPKSVAEKRAERIEERFGRDTTDERSLLVLTRAWIDAGNERLFKLDTQHVPIPHLVSEDFEAGLRAWNRYLKQTAGKANAQIAELVAGTYFLLVEIGSRDLDAIEANTAGAVRAERIAAEQLPSVFSRSNLAIYQYFNREFAAGDKTARALAVPDGSGASPLSEYRENAEKFARRLKRGARMLRESGEEELPAAIRGYGSSAGLKGGEK